MPVAGQDRTVAFENRIMQELCILCIPTVSMATGGLDPERESRARSRTEICDQLVH